LAVENINPLSGANIVATSKIMLEGPEEVLPNEVVEVQGSGADPNELIALSLATNWTLVSNQTNLVDDLGKGCDQSPLIPIMGVRHCVVSVDFGEIEINPACYAIIAWQHDPEAETNVASQHSFSNPYYLPTNATACKVERGNIFSIPQGHCECWKIALAAKLCK